jgi:hypothetical protein
VTTLGRAEQAVFVPGPDDVEATQYGVGLLSLGEDGDGGMLAVGTLDPRHALAAMHWHARIISGGPVLGTWARGQLREGLATGQRMLIAGWARFTRDSDWWNADPVPEGTRDAAPVVWLVDAWHPIVQEQP